MTTVRRAAGLLACVAIACVAVGSAAADCVTDGPSSPVALVTRGDDGASHRSGAGQWALSDLMHAAVGGCDAHGSQPAVLLVVEGLDTASFHRLGGAYGGEAALPALSPPTSAGMTSVTVPYATLHCNDAVAARQSVADQLQEAGALLHHPVHVVRPAEPVSVDAVQAVVSSSTTGAACETVVVVVSVEDVQSDPSVLAAVTSGSVAPTARVAGVVGDSQPWLHARSAHAAHRRLSQYAGTTKRYVNMTPDIMMGLLISFFLVFTAFFGFCCLMSLQTPSKFHTVILPPGKEA